MSDFIATAISFAYGTRCPEKVAGCPCCDAWAQYDALSDAQSALAAKDAEIAAKDFALRNGKSLAEDALHSIREVLREEGVPEAAFIDDHVANAIVQRNRAREALDQLLDDMGADGLCVCQAAKDQALRVLGRANHEA